MTTEPTPPDDWPQVDFLLQLREDQALGIVRPLREYLARFPAHEVAIAREFLLAHADAAGPRPDAIAGFEVFDELGSGGEGIVYRARDVLLGREVALKVLNRRPGDLDEARTVRAAAMAARLDHPAIVRVHGAGRHERNLWVATAYVAGHSLAVELERRRRRTEPFFAAELARLLAPIARALQHAHERGVVHRDVKPGNLLVQHDGTLVLTDFGMARDGEASNDLTNSGELRGTPAYMAPEQIRDGARGPAVDVFALGVVACECATLSSPFRGVTAAATLERIAGTELWSLPGWTRLDRDLRAVLLMATAKDPQHRYASAAAFANDLERLAAGAPVVARAPGAGRRLFHWARRNRALAASLVATTAVLLISCVVLAGFYWRERDLRQLAQASAERTRTVACAILFERAQMLGDADSIARRAYLVRQAATALQKLAADSPDDAQLQREQCVAWIRLGELHGNDAAANLGDTEEAQRCFDRAEQIAQQHLAPDARRATLLATICLRRTSMLRPDDERTLAGYRQAFDLVTPFDRESRAVRGAAAGMLAQLARDAGELSAARDWIEAAQREFRGDPDDPDSRQNLLTTNITYASILAAGGDPGAAEQLLRADLPTFSTEQSQTPSHVRLRIAFDRALANCLMLQGRFDRAMPHFDAAVQSARQLSRRDEADHAAARRLADMLDSRAGAMATLGDHERAAADRSESAAIAARFGFGAARDRGASERLPGR